MQLVKIQIAISLFSYTEVKRELLNNGTKANQNNVSNR